MDDRWGISIDVEGFSKNYEYSEERKKFAISALCELMNAIVNIGRECYPGDPDTNFSDRPVFVKIVVAIFKLRFSRFPARLPPAVGRDSATPPRPAPSCAWDHFSVPDAAAGRLRTPLCVGQAEPCPAPHAARSA